MGASIYAYNKSVVISLYVSSLIEFSTLDSRQEHNSHNLLYVSVIGWIMCLFIIISILIIMLCCHHIIIWYVFGLLDVS